MGCLLAQMYNRAMVHTTCGPRRARAGCQHKLALSPSMTWASLPPQGALFLSSVFVPRGLAHADNWVLKGIIFARYTLAHSITHSC